MKSKFTILLMVALLYGCNKDTNSPLEALEPKPLTLKVEVGSLDATRAVVMTGTALPIESQINVILHDAAPGGATYKGASEVYTYLDPSGVGGVWINRAINKLMLGSELAQVTAHYPGVLPSGSLNSDKSELIPPFKSALDYGDLMEGEYNSDNSFFFSFKKGEGAREIFFAEDDTDCMTGVASGTFNKDNNGALITMQHCFSMLVFHISKADGNAATCNVKSLQIKNADVANGPLRKGSFKLQDNTFVPDARIGYSRSMNNFPIGSCYGLLAFPAKLAADEVQVELLIDSHQYSLALPAGQWKSGKIYLYSIVINPTKAELVDQISVIDWATGKNDIIFDIS